MMVPLALIIIWLGVYPQPVLDTTSPLVETVLENKAQQARSVPTESLPVENITSVKGGHHE